MSDILSTFKIIVSGLVTCDSLHIIFGIMEAIRTSWEDLYHDNLLYIFPWFHYPFYRITLVCSIYMMIAVAIERFFAVCFPHNYHNLNAQRNRALYYIVPAIAAAFLVQIPTFFETKFVPRQVNEPSKYVVSQIYLSAYLHESDVKLEFFGFSSFCMNE